MPGITRNVAETNLPALSKTKGLSDFLIFFMYLGGALKPPIFICSIPKYSNL